MLSKPRCSSVIVYFHLLKLGLSTSFQAAATLSSPMSAFGNLLSHSYLKLAAVFLDNDTKKILVSFFVDIFFTPLSSGLFSQT